MLDGTDIYAVRNPRGWAYVYPPPFAVLMVPFALLPLFWSMLIWYVLSVLFLISAVVMCLRLVREAVPEIDATGRMILVVGPLIALSVWFMPGLARGQVNTLLLWLTVGAVYWQRKGQDWRAGSCLAGATLLKIFPIVLLGYFIWRKRWRLALATLVMLAVLTIGLPALVFGWQKNIDYLTEWGHVVAQPSLAVESARANSPLHEQLISNEKPRNQSLEPVLWRLNCGKAARPLAVASSLVMVGLMWWVGRKSAPGNELLIVSAVFVWMLLAQPLAESHYFVLLLLPMTKLVALARSATKLHMRKVALWMWIAFVLIGLPAAAKKMEVLRIYGALCWLSLALWAALLWMAWPRRHLQGKPIAE
ncbi:MAG: glycosyltransferase family 87 protein [Verrucomicrobiota bacterium]